MALYPSAYGQGRPRHPADQQAGPDVGEQSYHRQHERKLGQGLYGKTGAIGQGAVQLADDGGRDGAEREIEVGRVPCPARRLKPWLRRSSRRAPWPVPVPKPRLSRP